MSKLLNFNWLTEYSDDRLVVYNLVAVIEFVVFPEKQTALLTVRSARGWVVESAGMCIIITR